MIIDRLRHPVSILLIFLAATILLLVSTTAQNPTDQQGDTSLSNSCAECHATLDRTDELHDNPSAVWFTSTHAEAGTSCADCHGGDEDINATDPMNATGFIGQPDRNEIPSICGKCHFEDYQAYSESIHSSYIWDEDEGRATRASVCTDCHGVHHIEKANNPESPVNISNSPNTCAKCHDTQYYSYEDTYHGMFLYFGNDLVAVCADCHTNHDILPASDPMSTIHKDNLAETCEKCHGGTLDNKVTEGFQHNVGISQEAARSYYIGPFDLRVLIPLFYTILISVFMVGLLSIMGIELRYYAKGGKVGDHAVSEEDEKTEEPVTDTEEVLEKETPVETQDVSVETPEEVTDEVEEQDPTVEGTEEGDTPDVSETDDREVGE